MKKHPFLLLCIVLFIVGIISVAYLVTKERTGDAQTLFALIDAELARQDQEAAIAAANNAPPSGPTLARVDDTTEVKGQGFTMQVPVDWVIHSPLPSGRLGDGRADLGIIQNKPSTDLGATQGVVTINIYDVLESDDMTYDKVVKGFGWDDEDVAQIIAFMKEEAGDIFPDYSAADVKTETSQFEIDGMQTTETDLTCLKPCYIEGGAETMAHYFINGTGRVYMLFVSTGTGDAAGPLLSQAEEIVKTFTVSK